MKKTLVFLVGVFWVNYTFAIGYVTENALNGCANYIYVSAYFEPHQHTCNPGYYLPANYDGCVACPADATCPGGTFTFSDTRAQGINYTPMTQNISHGCAINIIPGAAIFEPNQYTCNAGYYVPANHDGCVICPENSYCPGGTYTFNENDTQGIVACAVGLYAPTGMWQVEQCGRILHIGEYVLYTRTTRKTEHALYVDTNSDGVADYYANATIADVPIHAGTDKRLQIKYDNTTYSIYDDTVVVPE